MQPPDAPFRSPALLPPQISLRSRREEKSKRSQTADASFAFCRLPEIRNAKCNKVIMGNCFCWLEKIDQKKEFEDQPTQCSKDFTLIWFGFLAPIYGHSTLIQPHHSVGLQQINSLCGTASPRACQHWYRRPRQESSR